MKGSCEICDKEIVVQMCCSGYECGCMGMPIDPPICDAWTCWRTYELIRKLPNDAPELIDIIVKVEWISGQIHRCKGGCLLTLMEPGYCEQCETKKENGND